MKKSIIAYFQVKYTFSVRKVCDFIANEYVVQTKKKTNCGWVTKYRIESQFCIFQRLFASESLEAEMEL